MISLCCFVFLSGNIALISRSTYLCYFCRYIGLISPLDLAAQSTALPVIFRAGCFRFPDFFPDGLDFFLNILDFFLFDYFCRYIGLISPPCAESRALPLIFRPDCFRFPEFCCISSWKCFGFLKLDFFIFSLDFRRYIGLISPAAFAGDFPHWLLSAGSRIESYYYISVCRFICLIYIFNIFNIYLINIYISAGSRIESYHRERRGNKP